MVCLADGLMHAELVWAAGVACWHRDQRAVRNGEMLSWDGGRQAAQGEGKKKEETRQGFTQVFTKEFLVDAFPLAAVIYRHRYRLNTIQQAQNAVEFYKAAAIASRVCALYDLGVFSFNILMGANDGSVWLTIAGLKYQSFHSGPVASDIHVASGLPTEAGVGGIIRTNWCLSA